MNILYLTAKFPFPLDQGDKLRAYWQIRYLSRFHRIFLCALSRGPVPQGHLAELSCCSDIQIVPYHVGSIAMGLIRAQGRSLPYQAGYFFSPRTRKHVHSYIQRVRPDLIFCQLIRLAPLIENDAVPIMLDYMDSLSERLRQKGNYPYLPAFLLRREYERTRDYERRLLERFAAFSITTNRDRANIEPSGESKIVVSSNGIDLDLWRPRQQACDYELLFAGNLGYGPNVLGAESLVKEVLPQVNRQFPQARVLLAGANPRRRVRRLSSERVHISGTVASMPDTYARGEIFVAPMWTGTGVQNKVLQALAMGKPCVISPLVAEGFEASIRQTAVVADSPGDIAQACISLLRDPARREECGRKGVAFVQRHHRWEPILANLESIIRQKMDEILRRRGSTGFKGKDSSI